MNHHLRFVSIFGLLALAAVGCGGGQTTGKIEGQVLYKGKPVQRGEINLRFPERGIGLVVPIEGGTFKVAEPIATGTYAVHLSPPRVEPGPLGKAPNKAAAPVPRKYQDPRTSNLQVTVQQGKNEVKLELFD